MGAYLYGEEAQTAEPAAATGQISKASPQPDLGSTVDYLTAKYGKPVKVEKAWCGGTGYGFRPTKMTYVYAIETNGVVNDITYFDFNKPQLTQEDSVMLFRSQFPIIDCRLPGPTKSIKRDSARRRESTGRIRNGLFNPPVCFARVSPLSAIQRIRDGNSVLLSSFRRSKRLSKR